VTQFYNKFVVLYSVLTSSQ